MERSGLCFLGEIHHFLVLSYLFVIWYIVLIRCQDNGATAHLRFCIFCSSHCYLTHLWQGAIIIGCVTLYSERQSPFPDMVSQCPWRETNCLISPVMSIIHSFRTVSFMAHWEKVLWVTLSCGTHGSSDLLHQSFIMIKYWSLEANSQERTFYIRTWGKSNIVKLLWPLFLACKF